MAKKALSFGVGYPRSFGPPLTKERLELSPGSHLRLRGEKDLDVDFPQFAGDGAVRYYPDAGVMPGYRGAGHFGLARALGIFAGDDTDGGYELPSANGYPNLSILDGRALPPRLARVWADNQGPRRRPPSGP